MMEEQRQPILVGVGQWTNRLEDPSQAVEPLEMMARVARLAAEDAGVPKLLSDLDSVTVINIISWSYENPAGQLASILDAHPRQQIYTSLGGNSPQAQVNAAAEQIARGEIRLALIAGAEAMQGLRLNRKAGRELPWSKASSPPEVVGDNRWGSNQVEQRHHAHLPIRIYPLFENALRARRGWSLARHRQQIGQLYESFAAIAQDNPHAWFRDGKTAEQITTINADNRMISFPYPKYVNAIMDVDQAAALILTSVGTARQLGIAENKWVYVRGAADAFDHWFVSDRVDYHSSPAIRLAGQRALEQARLRIDQVRHFDLYSCFPCAPQIAAEMLGVAHDNPRPLTVTGGLAYFGGPGSNYTTHAIARMVETLRAEPGAHGLVSALGWYLTKHAIGVYSSAPPASSTWKREDPKAYQQLIDVEPAPQLAERAEGAGVVETYTVAHDRDGSPSLGIVVARLADGRRCWANITDPSVLEHIEDSEIIGQSGQLRHHESTQVNSFEL
jgi:acetyl-CoA C-acetyltransferase